MFLQFAVADNGAVFLAGPTKSACFIDGRLIEPPQISGPPITEVYSWRNEFFALREDGVHQFTNGTLRLFHAGKGITALGFRQNEMLVGTGNGYYGLDLKTGRETISRQTRLPVVDITCIAPAGDDLWIGTTRGVFVRRADGTIGYYASKRWLADDAVVHLQPVPGGDVYVLTKTGLNQIHFIPMTLAEKAAHYEHQIRQRHIRLGFCAQLHLRVAGDIASAEMIDTDNDGTWSSYYLASQAFHYGTTGDEKARANAWETFTTMERLESINGMNGFPSRSFERAGFKVSDPDRWRPAPGGDWDWKATTSSDEIAAHTFACAVLYECAAKTEAEKQRIAAFFDKIMSHIVRNNFYLIDWDGKPTLWARWNPEYVNWYPPTIGDRRLNSAEIIASLQLASHLTGKELYRQKAFELMEKHGYLDNIMSSMRKIAPTPGYVHLGHEMGDEWNHSDDLLAFDTYWVLYRYAFNDELKQKFAAAIKDHFDIEKVERCPLWSFVYASTGAPDYDLEGALWTLRNYPLDLIGWTVQNSHRQDLTRLSANFRNQQSAELLSPSERRVMRWNGNPFVLDGGDGGHSELAGDEFLLPYWMARYLRIIGSD
jgi:hypothetical protein